MNILIGADPELFVKQAGEFVSAHNMVEGTKEEPFKVEGGAVQVDGMALEFNIDPAASEAEFLGNIKVVMSQLEDMVSGYEVVAESTAHFGHELIAEQPMEARDLGCDPDYNAYTGEENPQPDGDKPFRTAAGHIHIGWTEGEDIHDEAHLATCRTLVQALDITLGIPSLLWDKDEERRELYGKAGAFRPKSYGVEYRVLSNAWLKDERLMSFVYQRVVDTFNNLVESNGELPRYGPANGAYAAACLDKGVREEYLVSLVEYHGDGHLLEVCREV